MLTTKAWTTKTFVGTLQVLANTIVTYPFIVFCIILDLGFAFGAFIYIFTGIPCKKNEVKCYAIERKVLSFFLKNPPPQKKNMVLN